MDVLGKRKRDDETTTAIPPVPPPTPAARREPGSKLKGDGKITGVRHSIVYTDWHKEDQRFYFYDHSDYDIVTIDGAVRVVTKNTGHVLSVRRQIYLHASNLVTNEPVCVGRKPQYTFQVHRLWLLVTVGPPPLEQNADGSWSAYTGDHLNVNHTDDSPDNLAWASKSMQAKNKNKYTFTAKWTQTPIQNQPDPVEFRQFGDSGFYFSQQARVIKWGRDRSRPARWRELEDKKPDECGYIRITIAGKKRRVHRYIGHLWPDPSVDTCVLQDIDDTTIDIDHIDRNKANNVRSNLIVCTHRQNTERTSNKAVEVFDKNSGESRGVFKSLTAAAESCNLRVADISTVLAGRHGRKIAGNYKFKLVSSCSTQNTGPTAP